MSRSTLESTETGATIAAAGDARLRAEGNLGCGIGAARAGSGDGCAPGAVGAVIGHLTAQLVNPTNDPALNAQALAAAQLMGGVGGALVGADGEGVYIAAASGVNAAENNWLSHSLFANVRTLVAKENARLTAACEPNCTEDDFRSINLQVQKLESVAQFLETQKRSGLTTGQAMALGENIAALLPLYGTPIALYQAITGKSLSGNDLSAVERFFNGAAAALPMGTTAAKLINGYLADWRFASSVGGLGADGKALMDFSHLTSTQKGIVGELLGANTVQNALPGATRLGRMGEVGSQGIDDLYKVNSPSADYVIVEYKFGTSELKKTADGIQMSDGWVLGSDRVINAVGNPAEALKIKDAMTSGRVEKWVVHTDPAGGTTVWLVNAAGKIVPASSTLASKILGTTR